MPRAGLPKRFEVMALCILTGGLLLVGRLAYLQLVRGEEYSNQARMNATREVRGPTPRGRILDRDGLILADSRPSSTVFRNTNPSGWGPARFYPLGAAAAHVLGYLGEAGPSDLDRYPGVYRPGDVRGRTGVEAACDWLLRGAPATTIYEVTAEGQATRVLDVAAAKPGQDVRLTLDAGLQTLAFNLLGEAMVKVRRETSGRSAAPGGAVVVLDPRTGAILAMVSRPSFDPGAFLAAGGGDTATLIEDPKTPLLNRAVAGLYAPGSTFKIVTAVAALQEAVTGPNETIVDRGAHWLVPKKCWKPRGHGSVRLEEALAWSCNTYFYEMGLRLGQNRLAAWARRFGLGEPTGFDLLEPHDLFGPGRSGPAGEGREPSGTLATETWKASRFPEDPTFWPAEVADSAIGQGFHAYTPLQMAVAMAAIANGGTRWRPYVIDAVLDSDGAEVARARPEASGHMDLAENTLRAVREGLLASAMDPSLDGRYPGTAAWCFGPAFRSRWGVEVAGKTGTAEHDPGSGRADDAWFLAYAPYDDPRIVVAVLVEEGGSGSRVAAPVARDIIEAWLREERAGS